VRRLADGAVGQWRLDFTRNWMLSQTACDVRERTRTAESIFTPASRQFYVACRGLDGVVRVMGPEARSKAGSMALFCVVRGLSGTMGSLARQSTGYTFLIPRACRRGLLECDNQ